MTAQRSWLENQWGIAEPPAPAAEISPTGFDLVLVPLVAFDRECYRLGMGKGFMTERSVLRFSIAAVSLC